MKTISPSSTQVVPTDRSFLIYGEPKSGKTSLALSIAEAIPTLLIAAESDGWQDAYQLLSEKGKKNLTVVTLESRSDILNIVQTVKEVNPRAIVVDSLTEVMSFLEGTIKAEGGKNVVNGITQKISLAAYGDLATLTLDFVKALKSTGCHLIFTCGLDKEQNEDEGGRKVRYLPLLTGGKTGNLLPYFVRAIGFLQNINGKRQLWFESSPTWLAGTNYKDLANAKMIEDPTFIKIFSLFPRPEAPKVEDKPVKEKKAKKAGEVKELKNTAHTEPLQISAEAEPPFLDELTPEGESKAPVVEEALTL